MCQSTVTITSSLMQLAWLDLDGGVDATPAETSSADCPACARQWGRSEPLSGANRDRSDPHPPVRARITCEQDEPMCARSDELACRGCTVSPQLRQRTNGAHGRGDGWSAGVEAQREVQPQLSCV